MLKSQKGITLIALVITIVVLIILAGVSISLVLGENGLINRAREAAKMQANAEAADNQLVHDAEDYINSVFTTPTTNTEETPTTNTEETPTTNTEETPTTNTEETP